MQSLTLNADVEYDDPPLAIPPEKLFDSLPENIPRGEEAFNLVQLVNRDAISAVNVVCISESVVT
jgi:hypothetical protein